MGVEQLSQLRRPERWKSKDQSVAESGDEGAPGSVGKARQIGACRSPILCKLRKGWATQVVGSMKGGPPANAPILGRSSFRVQYKTSLGMIFSRTLKLMMMKSNRKWLASGATLRR